MYSESKITNEEGEERKEEEDTVKRKKSGARIEVEKYE